jgi:hypothetical protein
VRGFALVGASLAVVAAGCALGGEPDSDFTPEEVQSRPGPAPYFVGEKFEGRTLRAAGALSPVDADAATDGDLPAPTLEADAVLERCS